MRRLRRSASVASFIVFVLFRGVHISCAGCVDPRPLAPPGIAAASLLCAGCVDPRRASISYYSHHLGGLRFSAQAAWIRALPWVFLGSSRLGWARLGSPGSSGVSSVLFWARLGSPGLVWAPLGSPRLS